VDAHAHGFMAHDKLLLPILKALILRLLNIQIPIYFHAVLIMCANNDNFKITLEWSGKLGVSKVSCTSKSTSLQKTFSMSLLSFGFSTTFVPHL
jgi:hypothetical protein